MPVNLPNDSMFTAVDEDKMAIGKQTLFTRLFM